VGDDGTLGGFSVAAIFAKAADFRARDGDFDVEIIRDLRFQIFVKLRFEFTDSSAAHASDMDVITRAMAFVIMAMATEMEKVEFVDEAVIFEKVHRAIDRDARDIGVDLLRALENFLRVHVTRRAFEHFDEHHTLPRETNAAFSNLAREMARRLVLVDTFADRRTMRKRHWRWGITHLAIIADSF
jgi:hypothetical protein